MIDVMVIPEFYGEPVFLWPWRLEVTSVDTNACVDVGCDTHNQGNYMDELHSDSRLQFSRAATGSLWCCFAVVLFPRADPVNLYVVLT